MMPCTAVHSGVWPWRFHDASNAGDVVTRAEAGRVLHMLPVRCGHRLGVLFSTFLRADGCLYFRACMYVAKLLCAQVMW